MGNERDSEEKYCRLSDAKISLESVSLEEKDEKRGFSLGFWIYLSNSARPCSVLLHQINPKVEGDVPFVALNEESKLIIFPLLGLHEEAPCPGSLFPSRGVTHLSASNPCPSEKWVHIGCQVTQRYMCLHINAIMVDGTSLPLSNARNRRYSLRLTTLVGNKGNVEGYFYNSQVWSSSVSIKSQYTKDQPVRLFLDNSSLPDGVEAGPDGVWNIVGGKPSCRRNFSLEVLLLNGIGQPVCRDMEIMASLVYADNGAPVENSRDDGEDPLLLSCDGMEYPSTNRPVPLVRGRAAFKLKVAKLSSKCDNRLFRVFFYPFSTQRYPFLETYSQPIRCISRSKQNQRTTGSGRKILPTQPPCENPSLQKTSNGHNNGGTCGLKTEASREIQNQTQTLNQNPNQQHSPNQHENGGQNGAAEKFDQPEKRPKIECKMPMEQKDANENSPVVLNGTSSNAEEAESNPLSGSDSDGANKATMLREALEATRFGASSTLDDALVFRYCLEGMLERSVILREALSTASNDDMADFAKRVGLYTGCSHHRNQLLMAKKLIEEGDETWTSISFNKTRVLWSCVIPEIVKKFMFISHSSNRGLSEQDIEVLRGIAGCSEELGREDFERLWYWMYPVALTLARERINKLWECLVPRWIEGFITKEEAENALRSPKGPEKPGTFLLRFPTSRSWPHPDAGNLVISYVGSDLMIHHKLLALDYSDERGEELQHLLLEEPELTQLGRVIRPEVS
ncbi:hypothetical protein LUZ63_010234 [Rhynchospora breviuscula]|uniref:SH2 domain-containing protein n=1 Tax=Rhynchospora breviuscula TaxID=2022672 RepID=A0A9Q0HPA2_9POAL|nr:hypothetical protein LUZ63_010234 [Rhynchospora breviuscula]